MSLINQETLQQILLHYPKEQHELIKKQISTMEKIISKNKDLYVTDKGFQRALDIVFKKVIEGEFVLRDQ